MMVEFDFAEEFGSLEKVKDYCHAHPIFKSIQGTSGKKFYDLFDLVNIPRFRRSMRGCRREKKTAVLDASMLHSLVVYMLLVHALNILKILWVLHVCPFDF